MSLDLLIVLGLLAACIVMFVLNKPRMDVTALLVLIVLPLTGILTVPETLAGFSDPNVLLIAALFVIGAGLTRTGIAYELSHWLVRQAGQSEIKLIVMLMLCVAGLGSIMSSTGVVAIFIPITLGLAKHLNLSPSRLMMPLSFAGLISGMLTLVATPPNMVVNSALIQAGHRGLEFFSFTPIGVVIMVSGVVYMLVARRWLPLRGGEESTATSGRHCFLNFINDYRLAGRAYRVRVRPDSPLVGMTLRELDSRKNYQANILGIERRMNFHSDLIHPEAKTQLQAHDFLLIDAPGRPEEEQMERGRELGLDPMPLRGPYFTDQSKDMGMAEILIPPGSTLIGRNVLELGFRRHHQLSVIGLRRGNRPLEEGILEEKLRAGDTLLVTGTWKSVRRLSRQTRDFLVLRWPEEMEQAAPAHREAPYALISLGVMVILMISGWVPNVVAALIGCLLMGAFRCVDMESAYKSIQWPILLLIVGVMPFATALERTGGVRLAVDGLLHFTGGGSPHILLASLFVLTAVTGLFISNTATAVLMAPIAITSANHLGASPYPFAMAVALAASAAFMTPISSPVNTLVLGPGRYNFGDFVKIGVPFTILVMVISTLLIPIFFPLYP